MKLKELKLEGFNSFIDIKNFSTENASSIDIAFINNDKEEEYTKIISDELSSNNKVLLKDDDAEESWISLDDI